MKAAHVHGLQLLLGQLGALEASLMLQYSEKLVLPTGWCSLQKMLLPSGWRSWQNSAPPWARLGECLSRVAPMEILCRGPCLLQALASMNDPVHMVWEEWNRQMSVGLRGLTEPLPQSHQGRHQEVLHPMTQMPSVPSPESTNASSDVARCPLPHVARHVRHHLLQPWKVWIAFLSPC